MKLSDLKIGESAYILQVNGDEAFARRLSEIGFIRGEKIYNHMKAPLLDPVEYEIMGTTVTLRRSETKFIEISVEPVEKMTCSFLRELQNGSREPNTQDDQDSKDPKDFQDYQASHEAQDPHGNETIRSSPSSSSDEENTIGKKSNSPSEICHCQKHCQCQCHCQHHKHNEKIDREEDITNMDRKDKENYIINIEDASPEELEEATPKVCKFCPEHKDCEKRKGYVLSNLRLRKWNGQIVNVALVGNPNCGKTTLFNHISGGHEKEGNYCGVTVDSKEGTFIHNGYKVKLVDLPGTYSLASYSPEEKYVEDYLNNNKIDVILNVLDANNLERNLYLTLQAQKAGIPMVGALNMYDELEKRGDSIDYEELSLRLGMKFMPTVSNYGKGLKQLFDEIISAKGTTPKFQKQIGLIDTSNTGECYAFIHQTLEGIYQKSKDGKSKITSWIDAVVTNRWIGFLIFCGLMYLIFFLTFNIGNYFMDWIDEFFGWLGDVIGKIFPDGWFKDLIVDGIIGGVGGVVVFLPNILILYICISILEDSGYMARAAFILDRIMRIFGLHGKSFIPMICGFGCNVPAIMSTRGIENRKNRLVTILVASLFSCSARLPIYNVIAKAFFPDHVTSVIFSIYVVGVVLALVLAKIFSVFLVKEKEMNYLMELPEYRFPAILNVLKHTWERGKQYLKKMGTVILAASIIIWVLSYFPHHEDENGEFKSEDSSLGYIGRFMEPIFKPQGFNWQMDVGLLAGLGAKEVVVSTLNILYGGGEEDEEEEAAANLSEKLLKSGSISKSAAYSYMLFSLIYFPCIATVAVIGHEAGWRWSGFVVLYTVALAWVITAIFNGIASVF